MIKIDLNGLEAFISKQTEITVKMAEEKVKATALAIHAGLSAETPVDTGEARDGWQIVEAEDYTSVENSVPYIGRLNDGHSKQAPAGFVEGVVDEVVRAMK